MSLPPELIEAARATLGMPETATRSAVVRAGLAKLSGLPEDAYPLAKRGPKPGPRCVSASPVSQRDCLRRPVKAASRR